MKNPKFSIFKSNKKCLYYYRDAEGKIILTEEGFFSKQDCENKITLIKLHAPFESCYTWIDRPGNYYFKLNSGDGDPIAISIIFTTKKERDQSIRELKIDAQRAAVVDLSQLDTETN